MGSAERRDLAMKPRTIVFKNDDVEIISHHSLPTFYAEEHHGTVQICIPFVNARYVVQRQSETEKTITHRLGARDVLVIPTGQPHAVDWKRPADIVSLQLSESFIRRATGLDDLRWPDALTLRDPFISNSAAAIRSSADDDAINPAFAEAMATVIAYRVGLGAGSNQHLHERQRAGDRRSARTRPHLYLSRGSARARIRQSC